MLRSFVAGFVDKYVVPYATVDQKSLSVGISEGQVVLQNVALKKQAFDDLNLPVTVKSGTIRELRIDLSWENLTARPARMKVDGVELVLEPASVEPCADIIEKQNRNADVNDLFDDTAARQSRLHGQKPIEQREQSFFFRLFAQALNIVEVNVTDVHVRYEDGSAEPSNPFVAGIRLDHFEFSTSDVNWMTADWIPAKDLVHKLLKVKGLAVYWQHNLGPWTGDLPCSSTAAVPLHPDKGGYFILDPMDAVAKLAINRGKDISFREPRFTCDANVDRVGLRLECSMLRDLNNLVQAAAMHLNRRRTASERPKGPYRGNAKIWWLYSYQCVLKDVRARRESFRYGSIARIISLAKVYLPLYKRHLASCGDGQLSDEELSRMRNIESQMPLYAVMALRGRAEDSIEEDRCQHQARSEQNNSGMADGLVAHKGVGLFNRLFRGWKRENDVAEIQLAETTVSVRESELLGYVGATNDKEDFEDFEREPQDFVRYKVQFGVGIARLTVSDILSRTGLPVSGNCNLATCELKTSNLSAIGRPGPQFPFELEVSVASANIRDHVTEGPVFTDVLRMGNINSSEGLAQPFFSAHVIGSPLDGHASYVVKVASAPFHVVCNYPLWDRLSKFNQYYRQVDTRALMALISRQTAAKMDQQRLGLQRTMRALMEARNPVDLSLDISLPDIVLMQNVSPNSSGTQASMAVLRCGRLQAQSSVANMNPSECRGQFDVCEVSWSGIEAFACGASEKRNDLNPDKIILRVPTFTTRFDVATERAVVTQTQLKIMQTLNEISVGLSSESIRRVSLIVSSMTSDADAAAFSAALQPAQSASQAPDNAVQESTMAGVAGGWVSMFHQSWDALQRREIGMLRGLGDDATTRLKTYSEWRRIEYKLSIGTILVNLVHSNEKDATARKDLMRIHIRNSRVESLLRSLDANVVTAIGSIEAQDLVQKGSSLDGSDNHTFMIRSHIPAAERGIEEAISFQLHVHHRKSPLHAGVDVLMQATCFQLHLGSNLDTLAVIQNYLVEALEPALNVLKDSAKAGTKESLSNVKYLEKVAQEIKGQIQKDVTSFHGGSTAASTVYRPRPFSLRFEGKLHALDINLFTERAGSAFPVIRLQVRKCEMTNEESRKGRIEVKGSITEASLWDHTPMASVHTCVLNKSEQGVENLVSFAYTHFGRQNDLSEKSSNDGCLKIQISPLIASVSPRLIAEVAAYVYESSVFSANFLAIRNAASGSTKFRHRLDANLLAHRYRMSLDIGFGGLLLLLPESSVSKDGFILHLKPLSIVNRFGEDDAQHPIELLAGKLDNIRLASRVGERERDLITFSVECEMTRRLGWGVKDGDSGSEDAALMKLTTRISTINVNLSQSELTLLWRCLFTNLREVKAAFNHIGSGKARRRQDRSVLDLAIVKSALKESLEKAAIEQKIRQDLQPRASASLLDLHVEVTLEALRMTVETSDQKASGSTGGQPAAGDAAAKVPQVEFVLSQIQGTLRILSDTSYSLAASLADLRLCDVRPNSRNLYRDIVRSYPEDSPAFRFNYVEAKDGHGEAALFCSGFKVVLAADPILAIMAMVSNSFAGSELTSATTRAVDSPRSVTSLPEEPQEVYSWWLDSTLKVKAELGTCEISVLQNCRKVPTSSLHLAFSAAAEYAANRTSEDGTLNINDIEIFTLVPEQSSDNLYILEKSPVTVMLQNRYEQCRCVSDVKIFVRSLDLLITYQDIRTLFWMYKAHERALAASELMESAGVKHLVSVCTPSSDDPSSPRSVASASIPSVPLVYADPGWQITVGVQADYISVSVMNDCMGAAVPFATVSARTLDIEYIVKRSEVNFRGRVVVDGHFYNAASSVFEPVVEPCCISLEYDELADCKGSHMRITTQSRIEINVSEMHMRGLVQTIETWVQDGKAWVDDPDAEVAAGDKGVEKFWPYRLRNESGLPITFWLGSTYEPFEGAESKSLAVGGEEPFNFSQKRIVQSRQRDMSIEYHTLSIRFEGVNEVLTHVPVDIIGVHMLPLGELRAVAEVHNDSGSKIIAIQSTFKFYNKTSRAVEAAVYNTRSEAAAEPLWRETLSGDIHACVPLHLSGAKFLRIRPVVEAGRDYEPSELVEVPSQPVTGDSILVSCAPAAGSAPGTGPVFFRVRLDAKKPVGGHEESMRIVISIHPAFRVMNALPSALNASVYCESRGGKAGPELLEAVQAEQGAMTQLYCSDLKAPLLMAASTPVFRRARDPALVYHPDSSATTAKTLLVADDAGGQLALGVETTRSAWGDLTIVVFAQYLILNFSGLPLVYGPFARTTAIKPAPGQLAIGDGAATPTKEATDGADSSFCSESSFQTFQGLYTVFGPRSGFTGRPVATAPPLADSDITNANEIRGNVAVIHRGVVSFIEKARRASAAGAVGVIFVNSDDAQFLAEGDSGPGVRIPCVVVPRSDGMALDLSGGAPRVTVRPEDASSRQRASSNQLEWKRQVKALVRIDAPSVAGANSPTVTPDKRQSVGGGSSSARKAPRTDTGAASFPDSWMETPGDPPFMFSYDSFDLTGNKLCVSVRGAEWSTPFSLESMGTHGVLAARGLPATLPSLKNAHPSYELGLSFALGTGHFGRSKVTCIYPRYTVVNRLGLSLQVAQKGLEEDAHALLELRDGECHTFHWLDDTKPKAMLARVVPTIGTHETFTTGWAGPVQPEQVGTFALRAPPDPATPPPAGGLNLLVDIRVRKGACFLVFRQEKPEAPQYGVVNKTERPLRIYQEGSSPDKQGHIVEPGKRVAYAWDRPHDKHTLMLVVTGQKDPLAVAMDEFSTVAWPGPALRAQVRAEGSTRCLTVLDARATAAGGRSTDDDRSDAASEADGASVSAAGGGSQVLRGRHRLDVELAGVGVSVIDSRLDELLYASAQDIRFNYAVTRTDIEVELRVHKVQVDNQTDKGPEVVLGADLSRPSERPALHLSMVKSRLYTHMPYFKFLSLGVREMDLELEETFIMRLLDAAQNVVDASTISAPEDKVDDLRASGFADLRFLRADAPAGDKVYFELLELQPVLVNLSFYGTGAILQRASSEGGGLSYNPMFASLKALGVAVTSIDRAPIALNALVLERPFASQKELLGSVRGHYRTQLIQQLYKLVGSFEFLGNPVGLVNNLGTGVHDFFYEPAQGATKSPAEFLRGVSKGSSSLLSNSAYGLMNAASKVTGSAAKSLAQLSGDEDYIRRRLEASGPGRGGKQATAKQDLSSDIADGFMGIFAKPMAGAKQGGATGFFAGLGKGLLGAVVKPTAGLMDLASKSAEGAKHTAKTCEVAARVRPPRTTLGDGLLRVYDARVAHGFDAIRRLGEGAWEGDRYVGFCVLQPDPAGVDLAVVVTDQRVCVHRFMGTEERWSRPVAGVAAVVSEAEGHRVGLDPRPDVPEAVGTGPAAGPGRAWMACTDARSAEYLADIVRRAVSLYNSDGTRRTVGGVSKSGEYML